MPKQPDEVVASEARKSRLPLLVVARSPDVSGRRNNLGTPSCPGGHSLTKVATSSYNVATHGEGEMYRIGIKELKNRLSYYVGQVRKGEQITVTDRGRAVAVIVPTQDGEIVARLTGLARDGFASWEGGKPGGSCRPVKARGRPVSDIVLEDRR